MPPLPPLGDDGPRSSIQAGLLVVPIVVLRPVEGAIPSLEVDDVPVLIERGWALETRGIVDTFATRSLIDDGLRARLGLAPDGDLVNLWLLPWLLPQASFPIGVKAHIGDLQGLPYGLRLGMDVLMNSVLHADWPRGEFTLRFRG